MLLDSNVVVYACQPGGGWLSPWTGHPDAAIASVTRVEALGFTGISAVEEAAIRQFFQQCPAYALDDDVIERALKLRQQKPMKLGDAIIAATALGFDLPLVTRNVHDFKQMAGLTVINPFDSAAAPQP